MSEHLQNATKSIQIPLQMFFPLSLHCHEKILPPTIHCHENSPALPSSFRPCFLKDRANSSAGALSAFEDSEKRHEAMATRWVSGSASFRTRCQDHTGFNSLSWNHRGKDVEKNACQNTMQHDVTLYSTMQ